MGHPFVGVYTVNTREVTVFLFEHSNIDLESQFSIFFVNTKADHQSDLILLYVEEVDVADDFQQGVAFAPTDLASPVDQELWCYLVGVFLRRSTACLEEAFECISTIAARFGDFFSDRFYDLGLDGSGFERFLDPVAKDFP